MWKAGSQLEGGLMVNKNTYILREGTLENGETLKISLGIWASYEDITNEYQNSAFIGTIKLYADSIE